VSVVQSVMMIIPVLAVGLNQHMTVAGHFATLRYSPTLRFVVLGAALYTLVSLQGRARCGRACRGDRRSRGSGKRIGLHKQPPRRLGGKLGVTSADVAVTPGRRLHP
jgi:hypothetical protein